MNRAAPTPSAPSHSHDWVAESLVPPVTVVGAGTRLNAVVGGGTVVGATVVGVVATTLVSRSATRPNEADSPVGSSAGVTVPRA